MCMQLVPKQRKDKLTLPFFTNGLHRRRHRVNVTHDYWSKFKSSNLYYTKVMMKAFASPKVVHKFFLRGEA